MNLHLTLLIAYSAVLIAIGVGVGRLVKSTGAFFVAGRGLGPGLLFATMLAANIGAGSTVGAAGLGYRDGLAAWWWVGSAGIGSIILGLWVGPKIWHLAKAHDLQTVGDFLELRYNGAVRGVIAGLLWIGTLAILAGQLIALAWVLNVVVGLPKYAGCLIGGGVMIVYFTAGGLLTSAWVNLVQLIVLLVGFALAIPLLLSAVGGFEGLVNAGSESGQWNFWHSGRSGWIYLVLLGPAFIISPGLLQKIFGARSAATVRVAVTAQGLVLMLFAFLPPLFGMIARALHPELAQPELALPTVLIEHLPVVVGSIALAAIVSAEISSADAILFMLATSLSKDLYKRFLRPKADDREVLRVARLAAIAGGGLGVLLALLLPSVIGSLAIFYALLSVSLFVPVIAGLYVGRAGTIEAFAAILTGILAMLATHLATGGAGFGMFRPNVVGLLAGVAGFAIVFAGRVGRSSR